MKVFITIGNLGCGGAQKSLVSLLNHLSPENNMDIDLLILNEKDAFFTDIPGWIHRVEPCNQIKAMLMKKEELFKSNFSYVLKVEGMLAKILQKIQNRKKQNNNVQAVWKSWKRFIPCNKVEYDLAISYVDGFTNYYTMDKVKAKRKILWVHNEYEKLTYSSKFDYSYFNNADAIVTISDRCVESLNRVFPEMKEKIKMLPNLSASQSIKEKAKSGKPAEYDKERTILVSVGRLSEQKGFDMAVKAARIMKDRGFNFCWYILGQGNMQEYLERQISVLDIGECFKLLGTRSNPYPYIYYSTLFIQPSRYEGKSIVLDEAKILEKPIVVTRYDTVYDSITDDVNGTIVEFDENKLADKIIELAKDTKKQEQFMQALSEENSKCESEIKRYIELFSEGV